MRMLVKYTAFVDFDAQGEETDRSYYLSFVKDDDVMDLPFESLEALKTKANEHTLADYVNSQEFQEAISAYEDHGEFFSQVDTLVLYGKGIGVNFKERFGA